MDVLEVSKGATFHDDARGIVVFGRTASTNLAIPLAVNASGHLVVGTGTATDSLGKAEDSAHTSGDVGVMMLAVRQDTRAILSGTDGDYTPLTVNASGDLRIQIHAKDQNATSISQISSELANSNTLDHTSDRGMHVSDVVKYHQTADLSNVNVTYDDNPTSANSQDIDCSRFRKFTLSFTLTKNGTPTDIQFIIQFKDSDGNYMDYRNDFWGQLIYDDTAVGGSGFSRAFTGECIATTMRLRVVATGTDGAGNNFVLAEAKITLKN